MNRIGLILARRTAPRARATWGPMPGTLSQRALMLRRFGRHRLAVFSLLVLGVVGVVAALAEFVAPHAAAARDIDHAYAPPQLPRYSWRDGWHVLALRQHVDPVTLRRTYREDPDVVVPLRLFAPDEDVVLWNLVPVGRRLIGIDRAACEARRAGRDWPRPTFFFLGTDRFGRDLFSRLVAGSRISLSIGLAAIAITFVLGFGIGGLSGYCGGAVDTLVQRVIEVINAFPQLPLWMALGAVLPADWPQLRVYFVITLALSALNWTGLARVVRGKMLALRDSDHVVAARLIGAGRLRIILRHMLPACMSHGIVVLTMSVPAMILGETALSFLGLGLHAPVVSWGVLLQDCVNLEAVASYPWLLAPVLPVVLTVLAFNFVGDGLRDAADPHG